MGEGILITGLPYLYWFDDGIAPVAIETAVSLWGDTWERLQDDVKTVIAPILANGGNHPEIPSSRAIVYYWPVTHPRFKDYAETFAQNNIFNFKPEIIQLFSKQSAQAIYAHEFAHYYLTLRGDDSHRVMSPFLPREELVAHRTARETKADTCAGEWGYQIVKAREEEISLIAAYPELFPQ